LDEARVAFNDLNDNMDLLKILFSTSSNTHGQMSDDLKFLETRLLKKIKTTGRKKRNGFIEKLNFVLKNFKRFPYTEAIDILRDCTLIKKKNSTISLTNGVLIYNQNTNVTCETF
jgi:aspartyl/asparaginyl-tRNA synthetase